MPNASTDLLRIDVDDGKYTFVQDATGKCFVLRYGEPWLEDLPKGSNCWLAMAYELQELRSARGPDTESGLLDEALEALNVMATAFAGYADTPAKREAIALADAVLAKAGKQGEKP